MKIFGKYPKSAFKSYGSSITTLRNINVVPELTTGSLKTRQSTLNYRTETGIFLVLICTLTSGLIQAVCKKKTEGSHVTLRVMISAPVRVTDLVEVSNDAASLVDCTRKNFLLGMRFFW